MHIDTQYQGRLGYVVGSRRAVRCEIVGQYLFGRYTRVRLMERDGAHLEGDTVNAQTERFEKVRYACKALHWRYVTQCKGGRWIITRA